jgi:NAD(P)-dependent dehydrogenase (short-subunit alcohol dehydrogenase family)
LAVAELLAAQRAGVVVNGRDADAATGAAQRITGAVAFPGSPADPAVGNALIDTCVEQFGRIDVLVNCAGTAGLASESILRVTEKVAAVYLIDAAVSLAEGRGPLLVSAAGHDA